MFCTSFTPPRAHHPLRRPSRISGEFRVDYKKILMITITLARTQTLLADPDLTIASHIPLSALHNAFHYMPMQLELPDLLLTSRARADSMLMRTYSGGGWAPKSCYRTLRGPRLQLTVAHVPPRARSERGRLDHAELRQRLRIHLHPSYRPSYPMFMHFG